MRELLIGIIIFFVAAPAFGVTLEELNVAHDPKNLDNVIYGTTVYSLNFRAGPGKHFAVLGTVPTGTEVPVVGWLSGLSDDDGFWIRTWYKGERGWLCAYSEGERLIERNGGPLFTLRANEKTAERHRGKKAPAPGDTLEFVQLRELYWTDLLCWFGDVDFRVKYGDEYAWVTAYEEEDIPEAPPLFYPKPPAPSARGWTVDFDPEFLDLNLTYKYERCDFHFTDSGGEIEVRRGPGSEFAEVEYWFLFNYILFIDYRRRVGVGGCVRCVRVDSHRHSPETEGTTLPRNPLLRINAGGGKGGRRSGYLRRRGEVGKNIRRLLARH